MGGSTKKSKGEKSGATWFLHPFLFLKSIFLRESTATAKLGLTQLRFEILVEVYKRTSFDYPRSVCAKFGKLTSLKKERWYKVILLGDRDERSLRCL